MSKINVLVPVKVIWVADLVLDGGCHAAGPARSLCGVFDEVSPEVGYKGGVPGFGDLDAVVEGSMGEVGPEGV